MTKRKYKRGKQITSVADFEKSESSWYRVRFGDGENAERTRHRGFLISWTYHTLSVFISAGRVFEAVPIGEKDGDPGGPNDQHG